MKGGVIERARWRDVRKRRDRRLVPELGQDHGLLGEDLVLSSELAQERGLVLDSAAVLPAALELPKAAVAHRAHLAAAPGGFSSELGGG